VHEEKSMRTPYAAVMLALGLAGCSSSDDDSQIGALGEGAVETGGVTDMGAGQIRTWTELDGAGAPARIGIAIDTATLDGADQTAEAYVELSSSARLGTVFDHVAINYRLRGHGPESVYGVPHFDIHVYGVEPAVRMAVDCDDEPMPDPSRIPVPYFIPSTAPEPEGTCMAGMGIHALDPRSPELAETDPAPFSHTLILGYHAGEFAFVEPMVTQELLRTREEYSYDLNPPLAGLDGKLWPTRIEATYDSSEDAYHFVFDGLISID
jgi:hypothetical protein